MSRMLKALQQIEEQLPSQQRPEVAPSGGPDPLPTHQSFDEAQGIQETEPAETPADGAADDVAIEAALARAEVAAAMAAGTLAGEHDPAYAELAERIVAQLDAKSPACLMFTSPGDGEGKTDLLISLALAMVARTTGEVLLVDGNLRTPTLAGRLGVEAGRGLADVLMGVAGWQQVVRSTTVPRLSLLPGVRLATLEDWPPQRSNLGPLVEELNEKYQLVLIDTASLAHGEVAPMAQYCTGTYLVVRLGRTTGRAVQKAAEVLQECNGRLLGGIAITTGRAGLVGS